MNLHNSAPGSYVVKQGVPSRNGTRKHRVTDFPMIPVPVIRERMQHHISGSKILLSSGIFSKIGRPYCGERGDSFVVSIRLDQEQKKHATTRRSGYRELHGSIWTAIRTTSCEHSPLDGLDVEYTLPNSISAIALQGDEEVVFPQSKVIVCLTADNVAARWRTLIAIKLFGSHPSRPSRTVLRTRDCCAACAIRQATLQPEKCFLSLGLQP